MNYTLLYKYINQLFTQYFNKYRIKLEDKEDLIQDIIIKLFKKEQEGILLPEIEKNKNYIFISIKNEINYRLYTKKNLVDYYPFFNEGLVLTYPTIENDMDKDIRYKELQDILKSNKFNDSERTLVDLTFQGYNLLDIGNELNMDDRKIYALNSNLKSKLKFRLYPIYKYLLKYNNGNVIGIKSQNELTRKTGMSKDKIYLGFQIGKTKYKNYEIIKL